MSIFGRRRPVDQGSVGPASQNLIQTPDLARKLVTRYAIREKSPAPTLAAEIVPVVLVDDLVGESDLIVPRIRPASGGFFSTSAATNNWVHLFNPKGSRTILHVQYLVIHLSAAGDLRIQSWTPAAATPAGVDQASKGFRTGLLGGQTPVGTVFGDNTGAALPGAQIGWLPLAVATFLLPFDHVLDEGNVLSFGTTAAYSGTIGGTFFWTEETKER